MHTFWYKILLRSFLNVLILSLYIDSSSTLNKGLNLLQENKKEFETKLKCNINNIQIIDISIENLPNESIMFEASVLIKKKTFKLICTFDDNKKLISKIKMFNITKSKSKPHTPWPEEEEILKSVSKSVGAITITSNTNTHEPVKRKFKYPTFETTKIQNEINQQFAKDWKTNMDDMIQQFDKQQEEINENIETQKEMDIKRQRLDHNKYKQTK